MSHGGDNDAPNDFGTYMAEKTKKLREQFVQSAQTSQVHSNCFRGMVGWVNGHVKPPPLQIKKMFMEGGGIVDHYISSQTTHIICGHMPDAKVKEIQKLKKRPHVVTPAWVVDCRKQGKALSERFYVPNCFGGPPKLNATMDGFAIGSNDHKGHSSNCTDRQSEHAEAFRKAEEDTGSSGSNHKSSTDPNDCVQLSDQVFHGSIPTQNQTKHDCIPQKRNLESMDEHSETIPGSSGPVPVQDQQNANPKSSVEDTIPAVLDIEVQPNQGLTVLTEEMSGHTDTNDDFDESGIRAPPTVSMKPPKQQDSVHVPPALYRKPLSSKEDPKFLQRFYQSSRLHFIGAWRERYDSIRASAPQPDVNMSLPAWVVHIDMDCFFVSVALLSRPHLRGKPIAVAHGSGSGPSGEISCASYEARAFGIKAGSFMTSAKEKCPDLVICPYEFEKYQNISEQVYRLIHQVTAQVEALSVDEAFIQIYSDNPEDVVQKLRQDIQEKTGCTASAGIAHNKMCARIATKQAKPNGLKLMLPADAPAALADLSASALPGVGWATARKLRENNIETVKELQDVPLARLQDWFGNKQGHIIRQRAHGHDDTPVQYVPAARRSVGAQVSWGVRFDTNEQVVAFVKQLCEEVCTRANQASVVARQITVKIWKKREGVGEPRKFMGHGICDILSKSRTLPFATKDLDPVFQTVKEVVQSMHLKPEEVRGLGLQLSRIEATNTPAGSDNGTRTHAGLNHAGNVGQTSITQSMLKLLPVETSAGIKEKGPKEISDEGGSELPRNGWKAAATSSQEDEEDDDAQTRDHDHHAPFAVEGVNSRAVDSGSQENPRSEPWQEVSSRPQGGLTLSSSQLDPSVLEALPEDIRNEVLRQAKSVSELQKLNKDIAERSHLLLQAAAQSGTTHQSNDAGHAQREATLGTALPHSRRLENAYLESEIRSQAANTSAVSNSSVGKLQLGDPVLLSRSIRCWIDSRMPTAIEWQILSDVVRQLCGQHRWRAVVTVLNVCTVHSGSSNQWHLMVQDACRLAQDLCKGATGFALQGLYFAKEEMEIGVDTRSDISFEGLAEAGINNIM